MKMTPTQYFAVWIVGFFFFFGVITFVMLLTQ
jgi:hypothetical protein